MNRLKTIIGPAGAGRRLTAALALFACAAAGGAGFAFGRDVEIPAGRFDEGGWKLDVQFMHEMGAPYLLAHGLGSPVPDATATVEVPEAGDWNVYVRTRRWTDGAGRFKVLVGGKALATVHGEGSTDWTWERAGAVTLAQGPVRVALRDLDGFDGRCAGVVLTKGEAAPTGTLTAVGQAPAVTNCCDFVVVGGGLAGCCAAVAAARAGLAVALVQDRPVPGGNASGEVRVWSAGEIRYPLVNELRGKFMNMRAENAFSDADRIALLEREANLSCHYFHRAFGVTKDGAKIASVLALDVKGNRVVEFRAPLFCDATGDGWVGYWAGADYRIGREGRDETGESYAPEKGDRMTLGSSLMWQSAEATFDVPFSAPWAEPYACGLARIGGDWNWEFGLKEDVLTRGEYIRDRVLLAIYGAFSNAKKRPENAHRKLVTCPFVLGKRESRRLMGDWIFKEQDIREKRSFDDAVATGSWSVDLHYTIDEKIPFLTRCEQPHFGRYWIPYRSLYSRNVPNLFMAGRCFSCTHVGLGSPRVMNTLSQLGCAVGEAAALCTKGGYSPRELYTQGHARELQDRLGGDFPGRPDPKTASWAVIDDEDPSVTFEGKWRFDWNCCGGQRGDRTHYAKSRDSRATYPLPVKAAGRYRLRGLVPHLFNLAYAPVAHLVVRQGDAIVLEHEWCQLPGSGNWQTLAEVELKPGATLTVTPSARQGDDSFAGGWRYAAVADAYALEPLAD
ncbi:MAG: FAD-dependent oxidoreductase [Kiritimatiellia bacterium]